MGLFDGLSQALRELFTASPTSGAQATGEMSQKELQPQPPATASAFDLSDAGIQAIDALTEAGDFSLLPQLQERRDGLVWDGPIHDGLEHLMYMFQLYGEAVDRMAAANAAAQHGAAAGSDQAST